MKIIIETKFETYTTEFTNVDVSMEQIVKALTGMLLSDGWDIDTIKEYLKTEQDLLINPHENYENN
jgi:hypothetical protein